MQLIEKFHKMESENKLFDLGKDENLPLWDIIRYGVYIKYYYPKADRLKLELESSKSAKNYLQFIWQLLVFLLKIMFVKGKNIVFTASRYKDEQGAYFDRSAYAIINSLGKDALVLEPILGKKIAYPYLYDISNVLRRVKKGIIFPLKEYELINNAISDTFGESLIDYEMCNTLLQEFKSDFSFYNFIFWLKGTKKIFIATGNPKAALCAAKKLSVISYLIQHGSIEFDEIDYSYPKHIRRDDNLLFADFVLTFGDYWCKKLNVPAKEIFAIGNDFFYNKPITKPDESILVISTIVHGRELSVFVEIFAAMRPDLTFVFKLHPNEFEFYDHYSKLFKDLNNVKIISDEFDTNYLISKSQLVLLIVSAVLYEALDQNKKVAILKRINYKRQLDLLNLPNTYLFDDIPEFEEILNKDLVKTETCFYKKLDHKLLKKLIA